MTATKYYIWALTGLFLTGCAVTTMEARIAPQPTFQSSTIGANKRVGVIVVDERPSNDLGRRSPTGGTIRMTEDLPAIYQNAMMAGLRANGFTPVGGSIDGANVRVEIRGLNVIGTAGFWTMGSDIDSAVKVIATAGGETYENFYRAASSNRTIAVSGAKSSNVKINKVVEETFEKMMADRKLLETLAK